MPPPEIPSEGIDMCRFITLHDAPYAGIIQIRLSGRSSITSSQPASQAPLYLLRLLLYSHNSKNARSFQLSFFKYFKKNI